MDEGSPLTSASQPAEGGRFFARVFERRESGVFLALVALIVIMSLASPYFLSGLNIFNVLRGMSTIAIMSIGVTMVIVAGGIDLSVGSLLAVSGMFAARLMYGGLNPWVSALLGFALGLAFGQRRSQVYVERSTASRYAVHR